MAAKGSVAKEKIISQILENFEGAFKYDKEIRIPMEENGEEVQIKVTLTCAKTNVEWGGDTALPGTTIKKTQTQTKGSTAENIGNPTVFMNEPTPEEKKNVSELLTKLGLA